VPNLDMDTCPLCFGTFASRATHVTGNAVMNAAHEAKCILLEVTANDFEAEPDDLVAAKARIFVRGPPDGSATMGVIAGKSIFGLREVVLGCGAGSLNGQVTCQNWRQTSSKSRRPRARAGRRA